MKYFVPLLSLFVFVGCSERTVPISGTITLDGKPIKDCRVLFSPTKTVDGESAAFDSSGLTDENGRYTLTMLGSKPKEGVIVCDYLVRFGWDDPNPPKEGDEAPADPPYRLPETAAKGIPFTVPSDGSDSADFQLTNDQ